MAAARAGFFRIYITDIIIAMSEIKKIVVNGVDGQREYGIEDSVARQDVQEIVEGAPEELDSFREAFEAFKEGDEALASVNTAVEANAKAIEDEAKRAVAAEEMLKADITAEASRATMRENELESGYNAAAGAQAAALTQAVNELNKKIDTERENGKAALATEIDKLKDGDTIVAQTREIHSRNGKTVPDSFLIRTTAGSGTIGDGVASLKSVGGNIVKNLVDGTFESGWDNTNYTTYLNSGCITVTRKNENFTYLDLQYTNKQLCIVGHTIYALAIIKASTDRTSLSIAGQAFTIFNAATTSKEWSCLSIHKTITQNIIDQNRNYTSIRASNSNNTISSADYLTVKSYLVVDLTEMFGVGNEPDQATCDKLFGTMDALPQGLTIANPTEFKSIGFNQFNPENVLEGKAITNNAIVSGDKKIAVIPCLPCKVGTGENNGYCIHGDFGEDIKVYLTPLNPMEVDGELYMHELTKDATTDTYVPLIKGYMLVEVPTTTNLCAHFLWSEDKCKRDTYEPYFESKVELPAIPQMSEWVLAGIQSSGTPVCDEIDFERGVYRKKIGCVDMGNAVWSETSAEANGYIARLVGMASQGHSHQNLICENYTTKFDNADGCIYATSSLLVVPLAKNKYPDAASFKAALQGVMLYYELAEPEEYPLPKIDNNYISSDYGVEQFDGAVPCNANNLYYMRSLAGETRNFLDRLYANTGKEESPIAVADYITNGIEGNKELATNAPNLALRALFIAAGATYNGSTGYYELNGITDLTESDMMYIYEHKNYHFSLNTARYFQDNKNVRTILPMNTASTVYDQLFKNNKLSLVYTFMNSNLEVIKFSKSQTLEQTKGIPTESGSMSAMFTNAKKLKTIYPIDVSAVTSIGTSFDGTIALINVRLCGLKCSAIFKDSANISKESILYIIQYALPSSDITITLHTDAYAKLTNNADIVAALAAQPLIKLVSA